MSSSMKNLNISTPSSAGILILIFVIFTIESSDCILKDVYSWKVLDLQFPNEGMRQNLIAKDTFDQKELYIDSFEVWRDKIFLSLTSSKVPIRVAYISSNNSNETQSPPLIPYPDWDMNKKFDGTKVILYADVCDRLWICNHEIRRNDLLMREDSHLRIFIYDLNTDRLIRERELNVWGMEPITSLVVDVGRTCNKTFAYVTAPASSSIFRLMPCATPNIYDFENDEFRNINHYFPGMCHSFQLGREKCDSGPLQMSYLTPLSVQTDGYRTLYFESDPSSNTVNKAFTVSSKVLQNKTGLNTEHDKAKFLGCYSVVKKSAVFDKKTGFVFHIDSHQKRIINCWDFTNHPTEFSSKTSGKYTVNGTGWTLSSMRVDRNGNLWLLFGRFHDHGDYLSPEPIYEDIVNLKISMIPAAEVVAEADYGLSFALIFIIICAVVFFIYCFKYFMKKREKCEESPQATGLHQNH